MTNTATLNNGNGKTPTFEQEEEEQPSIFYLDFWEDKAKISFSFLGIYVEEILSITAERGVPQGVWMEFATRRGDDEIVYEKNGARWTMILENGDSYTGETKHSALVTKFVSIQNKLFQCWFDSKSGVIVNASIVEYDETTFGYPVIIECNVFQGEEILRYCYSRLMQEEEKIDFQGGTFTSGAVMYESKIQAFQGENAYETALFEDIAKWQLFPETPTREKPLEVVATLNLKSGGSVALKAEGERKYRCSVEGKWYALQHSVLVVLDEKTSLVGRVFTVYVEQSATPTQQVYAKQARTHSEQYKCYKLGYRDFDYFAMCEDIRIYWGSDFANGNIIPQLVYEKKYVLDGLWFEPYFVDPEYSAEKYKDNIELTPFYANGKMFLIFHEDGSLDAIYEEGGIYTAARTLSIDYREYSDRWVSSVKFYERIWIYSRLLGGRSDLSFRSLKITHDGLTLNRLFDGEQEGQYLYRIRFVLLDE